MGKIKFTTAKYLNCAFIHMQNDNDPDETSCKTSQTSLIAKQSCCALSHSHLVAAGDCDCREAPTYAKQVPGSSLLAFPAAHCCPAQLWLRDWAPGTSLSPSPTREIPLCTHALLWFQLRERGWRSLALQQPHMLCPANPGQVQEHPGASA